VPTYAYACTACGHRFEVQQSFSDAALTDCPECTGRLRKLFNTVGIVFKGSGFYRTDSRAGSSASGAESAATKDGGSSAEKPAASADKPASSEKPAASTSAAGSSSGSSSSGSSSSSSSGGSKAPAA
jgi:putative FmdB family regulatory protein